MMAVYSRNLYLDCTQTKLCLDCDFASFLFHFYMCRKDEMGTACSTMWDRRGALKAVVGRLKGKRSLGKRRRRWEDNVKMDLQAVG